MATAKSNEVGSSVLDIQLRGADLSKILALMLGAVGLNQAATAVVYPSKSTVDAVQDEQIKTIQDTAKKTSEKLDSIATSVNQIKGKLGIP